jgi:hypothetical protein
MDRCGPPFTYSLSVPVLLIPLFVLVFMPSTSLRSEALEELDTDETPQPETPDSGMLSKGLNFVTERLLGTCRYIRQDVLPMLMSTVILRGLFGILVVTFSERSGDVLLQYMHVRFNWSYEEVCNSPGSFGCQYSRLYRLSRSCRSKHSLTLLRYVPPCLFFILFLFDTFTIPSMQTSYS